MNRLPLMLAALLLAACTHARPGCTDLPHGGEYCLQASTAAPQFAVRQAVTAHFRDKNETLIADIENRADGLDFAAFTPFGLPLFQARYDNKTATATRLPDAHLSPEILIGMLQLALWPAEAVQRGLGKHAEVVDTADTRRIMIDNQCVMELHHDDTPPPYQRLQIDWPTLDMSLDIRALPENDTEQDSP